MSASQFPAAIPASVAASDTSANIPFAEESLAGGTVSGIVPSRLGFNNVVCRPKRPTTPSNSQSPRGMPPKTTPDPAPHATASAATMPMSISANFQLITTDRLEYRSASQPASQAKSTKGTTYTAVPTARTAAGAVPTDAAARFPKPMTIHLAILSFSTVSDRTASRDTKPDVESDAWCSDGDFFTSEPHLETARKCSN